MHLRSPFSKQSISNFFIIIFSTISLIQAANSKEETNYFNKHYFFFEKRFPSIDLTYPVKYFFWSAGAKTKNGNILAYEYCFYEKNKFLSINIGTNLAYWRSGNETIYSTSLYLTPRIWLFHTKAFSFFINISAGGPTLLTSNKFMNRDLGKKFTFQDYIGIGINIYKSFELSLKYFHYSNAGLFQPNFGFDSPGVISICYTL